MFTIISARRQPLVNAILFSGPLLPGKFDICDIPVEKMTDLTIALSGRFDQKSFRKLTLVIQSLSNPILDLRKDLFSAKYIACDLKE